MKRGVLVGIVILVMVLPSSVAQAATTWYLAEGSTQDTYDTWVLIQNPYSSDASVTLTFMKEDGTTVQQSITVSATSRYSVHVNSVSGLSSTAVSTKVQSTNGIGIIAERAMYWTVSGETWGAGHCSRGVTNTATTWYLAEGSTQSTFDTWILIQNPYSKDASVTLTYMKGDGTTVQQSITVSANSRYNVHVNNVSGLSSTAVSTKIQSTNGVGIIVERSMYWDVGGVDNAAGHCSVGVASVN